MNFTTAAHDILRKVQKIFPTAKLGIDSEISLSFFLGDGEKLIYYFDGEWQLQRNNKSVATADTLAGVSLYSDKAERKAAVRSSSSSKANKYRPISAGFSDLRRAFPFMGNVLQSFERALQTSRRDPP